MQIRISEIEREMLGGISHAGFRAMCAGALISLFVTQPSFATPPSSELRELFSVGSVSSVADAERALTRRERQLADALVQADLASFTNGPTYLKRHPGKLDAKKFRFYFNLAENKSIQPTGKKPPFTYGKYYFPTSDLYYQLRIPFVTDPAAAAEVKSNKPADEQQVPLVWLFVSKSGRVLSFW